jgi:hypothetical protein
MDSLDRSDIESLIPFVFYYPGWKARQKKDTRQIYADQANWL